MFRSFHFESIALAFAFSTIGGAGFPTITGRPKTVRELSWISEKCRSFPFFKLGQKVELAAPNR